MKKLNITKNKILVEGKPYTVLEIDKSTIIIRGKTKDVTNQHDITNDEGVYLFIVNKDIPNFSKEEVVRVSNTILQKYDHRQ